MLEFPQKLKPLFYHEGAQATVIGSLEDNFFIRASDIMKEFLKVCEKMETEELEEYLNGKFSPNIVKLFFKKLDDYKKYIFFLGQDKQEVKPYNFNQKKRTLTLNISHACNLKCTYCFEGIEFRKNSEMMDKDTAIKATSLFLEQLGDTKGTIIFTGGEPLLNITVFKEVVNFVKSKTCNVKFLIKTNGTLISRDIMDYLISNEFIIQISMDGCKDAHDCHRKYANGEPTFNIVENVIHNILDKDYGHNLIINGTVTHQNIELLEESYEYFKSIKGIKSYFIKPVMGEKEQEFTLSDDDYKIYTKNLFSRAKEEYAATGENDVNYDRVDGICGIGVWHISVDTDGKIYPCYRLSGIDEFLMGDIMQTGLSLTIPKKLADLYNIDLNSKCSDCFGKLFCKRGCYANKLLAAPSDTCKSVEKQFGEFFLIENLVNSNVYMQLPMI